MLSSWSTLFYVWALTDNSYQRIVAAVRYFSQNSVDAIQDLRGFRQSLTPRKTLGQAARGAEIDKSLLSRIETGKKGISVLCARRLARFYSRATGQSVTAGEILDMAELALARRRAQWRKLRRIRSSGAMVASEVQERSVAS
jgi:hypothetical protein